MLATFASILDFFQYAFKDIISKASSSDASVHFFHKPSCAISISLDVLDKFYKMTYCFVNFLFASVTAAIPVTRFGEKVLAHSANATAVSKGTRDGGIKFNSDAKKSDRSCTNGADTATDFLE